MKKLLLLFLLLTTQLFSLSIILNSAKESGAAYAILHIQDDEPIDCQVIPQALDRKVYLCKFNKITTAPLSAKKMKLVTIDFLKKEKEFYIKIEPKVKSRLIPIKSSLYVEKEVTDKQSVEKFMHWTVLLYEESPFTKKIGADSIDFPILYPKILKPYIGALDLNGAPIAYVQSKDIRLYLDLKKSYENEKYEDVIKDSLEIVTNYPQTIFKSEFLLYRLRAIDKGREDVESKISDKFDASDIVSEAKQWIKSFPSEEDIPEVLLLIVKSYLDMGFKSDMNYFLDILLSEHENSSYTKKAILLFADSLYGGREQNKAIKLYQDVLYSASDLDIASEAAIRLVDTEINRGKTGSAKEYLIKVLSANKDFLLKDREKSYALATKLAANKLYDVAAQIADLLIEGLKKSDDMREPLIKDSGVWHTKANDIKEAYDRLVQYQSEYKNGEYAQEVQESLDGLFFELNETNETKLANYYDTLIDKYKNKIGDKAVIEKAKLLLSHERYTDVLKMEESLKYVGENNESKAHELLLSAVNALTILSLKDDKCSEVIVYVEKYNLDLATFDKEKVFDCLIRTSRFDRAKEFSEKYIKDDMLEGRFYWLQKYLLSLYNLNKYASVIEVGNDVQTLSKTLKKQLEYETLSMMFSSQMKLGKFERALSIAKEIEKAWPEDIKNSEVYIEIVKKSLDDRNDLLASEYAKKIIAIQNKFQNYGQSPFVEFSYIAALKRLGEQEAALSATQTLLTRDISEGDKVRAYYTAGELSLKLKKDTDAKEYFKKCSEIKVKSSWKDICEQNLKLL